MLRRSGNRQRGGDAVVGSLLKKGNNTKHPEWDDPAQGVAVWLALENTKNVLAHGFLL